MRNHLPQTLTVQETVDFGNSIRSLDVLRVSRVGEFVDTTDVNRFVRALRSHEVGDLSLSLDPVEELAVAERCPAVVLAVVVLVEDRERVLAVVQ